MLVIGEYLVAEFVDKLIEAEVDLSLDLIKQELLLKVVKRVLSTVVVQVKRV